MSNQGGLLGLIYAVKGILEATVVWVIATGGVLLFFYYIIGYIASRSGYKIPFVNINKTNGNKNLLTILFLLFLIFSLYGVIRLVASFFGVNSTIGQNPV